MAMAVPAPDARPPYRVQVLLASMPGWYDLDVDARGPVVEGLHRALAGVEAEGARLVASFDDDLLVTGQPASVLYSISILYDVDDLAPIVGLVHRIRTELGRYFRVEARLGRRLFLLDR
jgi:hypothetical protein